jgi:hypothetical protein
LCQLCRQHFVARYFGSRPLWCCLFHGPVLISHVYCYWILKRRLKFKRCPESTSLCWEQFSLAASLCGLSRVLLREIIIVFNLSCMSINYRTMNYRPNMITTIVFLLKCYRSHRIRSEDTYPPMLGLFCVPDGYGTIMMLEQHGKSPLVCMINTMHGAALPTVFGS